jgi:dCTP deaminase
MILSDGDILRIINEGMLKIEPFDEKKLTPNGYDLSVEIIEVKKTEAYKEHDFYMIKPLTHFMVLTKEKITMPDNIVGDLRLKTKWARQGVMATFGAIDAGFIGKLNLSMFNGKDNYLHIPEKSTICQLLFNVMHNPAEQLYAQRSGNYQNQNKIIE